jgi:glycogen debranching enzyme
MLAYNLVNSPHLRVAYEIDEAILTFSANINLYQCSSHPTTAQDVDVIVSCFQNYLTERRLWEYYVLDVDREVDSFLKDSEIMGLTESLFEKGAQHSLMSDEFIVIFIENYIDTVPGSRYGKSVNLATAIPMLNSFQEFKNSQKSQYRKLMEIVNLKFYAAYDSDFLALGLNLRNRIIYERIAENGPKKQMIGER